LSSNSGTSTGLSDVCWTRTTVGGPNDLGGSVTIGFMYPDYRYPPQGQKRKSGDSGRDDASAAPSKSAPKRKRVKVLTHRPRYIEPTVVPDFGGETSSVSEGKKPAISQKSEPAVAPKTSSAKLDEPKAINIEEMKVGETRILEAISPSAEVAMPKAQKDISTTPKRKRMVNVLDVLEIIKTSSSTPKKAVEASETHIEAEASKVQVDTEAGPSEPAKEKSLEIGGKIEKETAEASKTEKTVIPIPETLSDATDYIIRHASGKRLSEKEKQEAQFYAQRLKYPKGALVFNGSGEEDFLYCLPDSKEISVCREMSKSFDFPTLEDGLSVLSKDELADSLAYNSLKVRKLDFCI
jgi:hypothetical protein